MPDVVVRLRAIPTVKRGFDTARRSWAFNRFCTRSGYLAALYNIGDMAVRIEMQNTGDPRARGEIVVVIEHVLSDRPGEWRVSIVGSRANEDWEMKVRVLRLRALVHFDWQCWRAPTLGDRDVAR